MEDILAIILIFGGGAAVAISFSPVGRAFAERIRGRRLDGEATSEDLDDLRHQLQEMREQVSELAERQDFTERVLAQQREKGAIGPGAK